jgi:hypothetical protein
LNFSKISKPITELLK